jgi:hypothetical protein
MYKKEGWGYLNVELGMRNAEFKLATPVESSYRRAAKLHSTGQALVKFVSLQFCESPVK